MSALYDAIIALNKKVKILSMWRGEDDQIYDTCDRLISYAAAIMALDKGKYSVIVRSLKALSRYDEKMIRLLKSIPEDMTQPIIEELYEDYLVEIEPISKGMLRHIITSMVSQYFLNNTNGKGLDLRFVLFLVQKGWFHHSYDLLYKIFGDNIEDVCEFAFGNKSAHTTEYMGQLTSDIARNALDIYVIMCGAHDLQKVISGVPESKVRDVINSSQSHAVHMCQDSDSGKHLTFHDNVLLTHSALYLLRSAGSSGDPLMQEFIDFLARAPRDGNLDNIIGAMKVEDCNRVLRALRYSEPVKAANIANLIITKLSVMGPGIDGLDLEMVCKFMDLRMLHHRTACQVIANKIDEMELMFLNGNDEVVKFVTRSIPEYLAALQDRRWPFLRDIAGRNGVVFHEVTNGLRFNFVDGHGVSANMAAFLNGKFYAIFTDALKSFYSPKLAKHFIDVAMVGRHGAQDSEAIIAKFMDIAGSSRRIMRNTLKEIIYHFSPIVVSHIIRALKSTRNLDVIYEDFDKKDRDGVLGYIVGGINALDNSALSQIRCVNFLNPYRKSNSEYINLLSFTRLVQNSTFLRYYGYVRHMSVVEFKDLNRLARLFENLNANKHIILDWIRGGVDVHDVTKYTVLAGVLDSLIICFGNHNEDIANNNLRPLNMHNISHCNYERHNVELYRVLGEYLRDFGEDSMRGVCHHVHNIFALRKFCTDMFAERQNLISSLDDEVAKRNVYYFGLLASSDKDIDKKLVARDLANNVNHSSHADAITFIESLQGKPKKWLEGIAKNVRDRDLKAQIQVLY